MRLGMYDNIVIRLEEGDLPVGYDWHSVLSKSSQRLSYTKGNGVKGVWRAGWVTARNGYIEFRGSLPKCLYGHNCNVKPVTLSEVRELVEEMSDDFSVPMSCAEVTHLEFSTNFIVSHSPEAYINAVRGETGFDDWNIRGTKYIEREGLVRLKFYDKLKEARSKKELPNPCPLYSNLLRYEMTLYHRRLRQMFGRLRCADLWDKSVYWRLVSEWLYHFERMQFSMVYDADFRQFRNVTGFEDWAICALDAEYGLIGFVKSLFDTRSEPKPNDRIFHHKLKKRIDRAKARCMGRQKYPELIEELKSSVYSYLSWLYEDSPDRMSDADDQAKTGS